MYFCYRPVFHFSCCNQWQIKIHRVEWPKSRELWVQRLVVSTYYLKKIVALPSVIFFLNGPTQSGAQKNSDLPPVNNDRSLYRQLGSLRNHNGDAEDNVD